MSTSAQHNGIHYYGDSCFTPTAPAAPLNAVFLTSVRDTGTCDRNGSMVETEEGLCYMEGTIERTVKETREGGTLAGILRIVAVVTDDLEKDMRGSAYPIRPHPEKPWIHGHDLRNADGALMAGSETTFWIPSDFRALPRGDTDSRTERKLAFESKVAKLMEEKRADILISDHYMARIAFLMNDTFHNFGRILNIHPAVTVEGHPHCFRGKTPTQDAIDRARSGKPTLTGATLHLVDEIIDHGPPLAFIAQTPVCPSDEPQQLRYRNYQRGKLPLFIAGMRHYVERIYPHLDRLNLKALTPLDHVPSLHPR